MTADLTDRLTSILLNDNIISGALRSAQDMDLPDWRIVAGAIYNTVWNHLTDKPSGYGIKDIDLFYFDPDTSWEAEDAVIRRGANHFAPSPPIEIRNQARVPLWYKDRFGHPIPEFQNCRESIDNFAMETHAVSVSMDRNGRLDVYAPYGLDAIFEMRMVPNTRNLNRRTHEDKAARNQQLWPEITIEPWPDLTVIPACPWHDWDVIRELVARAFASMEGRIDPPSSLHRMTAKDLAADAARGAAFLAHDGFDLTGCVFCRPEDDALYVGKLAVDPSQQGRGVGQALMAAAEGEARRRTLGHLELQTRIELTENYAKFVKMGFTKSGETAHPGFDRPTSITMRKRL